jgi:hypothetical protein
VKVAKIMKAGVRQWPFRCVLVAGFDDLPHERGHRVWVQGLTPTES